mmetsp:Transcript_15596/g.19628  ORF Transcript_15596/g.19628 Transcript_15596/m.19628 type:complete len:128 (+) Transcript_15596:58-441(+)
MSSGAGASQSISYSLYYSHILELPLKLLFHLFEYQHVLGDHAIFIPRLLTFECPSCPISFTSEHCVCGGRYCFRPPSQDQLEKYPKMTNEQLKIENMRSMCVFEVSAGEHFFNYMYLVHFNCLQNER